MVVNISYFAGFVCDYQYSELYIRYFASISIIYCLVISVYILGVKRIKNNIVRRLLTVILIPATIIGIHILYLAMINGDIFGCGIFPWFAHPNSNIL